VFNEQICTTFNGLSITQPVRRSVDWLADVFTTLPSHEENYLTDYLITPLCLAHILYHPSLPLCITPFCISPPLYHSSLSRSLSHSNRSFLSLIALTTSSKYASGNRPCAGSSSLAKKSKIMSTVKQRTLAYHVGQLLRLRSNDRLCNDVIVSNINR